MNRSAQPFPFWRADERGRTLDAEERDLLLEVIRHVLRAVVVSEFQSAGDGLGGGRP